MKANITALTEAVSAIVNISEGRDVEPWQIAAQACGFLCAIHGIGEDEAMRHMSEAMRVANGGARE